MINLLIQAFIATATGWAEAPDWRVVNGAIFKNNTLYRIKGVSWFGFEDCNRVAQGLWVHPLSWYFDFLKENDFNVVRVPISQEWVLTDFETASPPADLVTADPSLENKRSIEILDRMFDEAHRRGMFLLMDMHRLGCASQDHELWYSLTDGRFTTETFFKSWQKIIDRYSHHPSWHAIDLLNEPRGLAEWSDDPSFSWNMFVESAYARLTYAGLRYVEGVDWGRDFEKMQDHWIEVPPDQPDLVFSPHQYGPSVTQQPLQSEQQDHADWARAWGYLVSLQQAVVLGEFGGRYEGADRIWQEEFVDYLLSVRVPGIYWALNPTSRDTGGILADDWTTPIQPKLDLLKRLQPDPTF